MFRIRKLVLQDADELHAMANSSGAFDLSPRTRFFSLDYLRAWLADPEGDVLYGAEEQGRLVGFVLCQVMRSRWVLWHNLFVVPEQRRRGIGQALFGAAMQELADKGVHDHVAFTRDSTAIDFHRANSASTGHELTFVEWSSPTIAERGD